MMENENKNLKISYHIADTMGDRRPVRSSDAYGNYKSFEEAQRDYKYDPDGDNAILANINGDWYRTAKFTDGVVRYRSLARVVSNRSNDCILRRQFSEGIRYKSSFS